MPDFTVGIPLILQTEPCYQFVFLNLFFNSFFFVSSIPVKKIIGYSRKIFLGSALDLLMLESVNKNALNRENKAGKHRIAGFV
jgi:hypothetical protein